MLRMALGVDEHEHEHEALRGVLGRRISRVMGGEQVIIQVLDESRSSQDMMLPRGLQELKIETHRRKPCAGDQKQERGVCFPRECLQFGLVDRMPSLSHDLISVARVDHVVLADVLQIPRSMLCPILCYAMLFGIAVLY